MAPNASLIDSKSQLVEFLEKGSSQPKDWRIGTEHEKLVVHADSGKRLGYDSGPGIKDVLEGLARDPWEAVYEKGNIIALKDQTGASITLEPGGQFELSGAPLENLHQTCKEVAGHLRDVKAVADDLNIRFVGLGYDPVTTKDEMEWMPKGRYGVMGPYMPTVGNLGQDMMLLTTTVQTNLDYQDEADMVRKMRISVALQPLITALFANSPFRQGKPSGYLSFRSHCWTDTDPDRCGMLPFVFDQGFGFERWVDYLLDAPMYFVYRDGIYNNVAGKSFRDFMAGRLEGFEGQLPTMKDWEDHLTVVFPEVRLKTYIEMRGADSGPHSTLCSLPALWVGLLYDSQAMNEAEALIKDWSIEDMAAMRDDVPAGGLKTKVPGHGTMQDLAQAVLKIAEGGLRRRGYMNGSGDSEALFLKPLFDIARSGQTHADRLLALYHGEWNGDLSKVYEEMSY